ncbi:MAG: hypothetical protein FJX78_06025 [Armatimonadetes bacterium]|nr:hypothetical protein [Armatimonadota bacterium]
MLGGGANNPLASMLGGLLGGGSSSAGGRPSPSGGNLMELLQMVLKLIQLQPGGLAGLIDGLSQGGLQ